MQELKILGRIDLPEKKIRPEDFRKFLEYKMMDIQKEVNGEFTHDFLDEKAAIVMAGGSDLESNKKFVKNLEFDWATLQHKTLEEWRQARDRNPSIITEMAITLVLHKIFGKRFIVARASSFDDYKHRVDNVLIDKQTGAVVCGFDDVIGYEGDDGGEKKSKKIRENILHGGTTLKYGATIDGGQLVRKELNNIPTFYLSLSKDELNNILVDLKATQATTENEKKLVNKIISSLDSQYQEAKEASVNSALQANLEKFAKSLELIKQLVDYDENR